MPAPNTPFDAIRVGYANGTRSSRYDTGVSKVWYGEEWSDTYYCLGYANDTLTGPIRYKPYRKPDLRKNDRIRRIVSDTSRIWYAYRATMYVFIDHSCMFCQHLHDRQHEVNRLERFGNVQYMIGLSGRIYFDYFIRHLLQSTHSYQPKNVPRTSSWFQRIVVVVSNDRFIEGFCVFIAKVIVLGYDYWFDN